MTQEGSLNDLPPLPAAASPKQKTLDRMLGATSAPATEPKAEPASDGKAGGKSSKASYDDAALKPSWEPGKECVVDRSIFRRAAHPSANASLTVCPTLRWLMCSLKSATLPVASRSLSCSAISSVKSSPTAPPTSFPPSISPPIRHAKDIFVLFIHNWQLAPAYEGLELGIGESILMKAVADSTGRTLAMVKSSFQELGDLGTLSYMRHSADPCVSATKLRIFTVAAPTAHLASLQVLSHRRVARCSG